MKGKKMSSESETEEEKEESEDDLEKSETCGEEKEDQKEQEDKGVDQEEQEVLEEEEEELTKEELEEEVEELESSLKKVMADFENYKKRMVKERQRIRKVAAESLMEDLIAVLDDFERALDNGDELEKEGIKMIYKKFRKILTDHGLEEIEAEEESFDPMYHECVESVEKDDVEKDKILKEYQKGYKLNDKVIRPSRVKVAR